MVQYAFLPAERIETNSVTCLGPVAASSETLSHGSVYLKSFEVMAVLQVHSAPMWLYMLDHDYARTRPGSLCGTVALARDITDLVSRESEAEGLVVLPGHEEGVLAFGPSPAEAWHRLEKCYELSQKRQLNSVVSQGQMGIASLKASTDKKGKAKTSMALFLNYQLVI